MASPSPLFFSPHPGSSGHSPFDAYLLPHLSPSGRLSEQQRAAAASAADAVGFGFFSTPMSPKAYCLASLIPLLVYLVP
jgi:hypothetical protein